MRWLKKCRRLLIERQRGQLIEKEVIESKCATQKKANTPEELKSAKAVAARMMDELCGVRLDVHSAKAVCAAADDLAKMDALYRDVRALVCSCARRV